MKVTILTPTYNRLNTLPRLYDSLLKQTSKEFEWLIIDDGSKDNTKNYVNNIIKENKITIKYFYKNNGGKHRALNYGINKAINELIFFVDSDDWLKEDAVEQILYYGEKYKNNPKVACLSFHRAYPNMEISGPHYKQKEFISNYVDYRINEHVIGEGSEVVFADKLKEFPFLEIEGENFLSEGYLWIKMGMKYDTVYIDKAIYYFEYLQDGLTKNILKIKGKNPKGCVEVYKLYFNKNIKLIPKTKAMIKYINYSKIAKYTIKKSYKDCKSKLLFILVYPLGFLYYLSNKKYI